MLVVAALALGLVAAPASARAGWKQKIDDAIAGHSFGVTVRVGNHIIYNHGGRIRRTPASNEKLLTSMAAYQALGPHRHMVTRVLAHRRARTIRGNLFLVGRGDPAVTSRRRYARSLPFPPTRIRALARRVAAAGVRRVKGRVLGATGYFSHDWWAPGWKASFPTDEVALPSALTFNGNTVRGRHISNPEYRAARSLTRQLRKAGVGVSGPPGARAAPRGLVTLARTRSQPVQTLLRFTDRQSVNWYAEMFAKRVGVARYGAPGTIAKGARAITALAARQGVGVTAYDGSGLSYRNRVSPRGLVTLLAWAAGKPWGRTFRHGLAGGGQGTLEDRLQDVRVRAKTGTLDWISALSGYVWLTQNRRWAEFSIMDSGMYKSTASGIEDRIVRILYERAHSG